MSKGRGGSGGQDAAMARRVSLRTAAAQALGAATSGRLTALVDSFEHLGPGGDGAMPTEVRAALEAIPRGATTTIAGVEVRREERGDWNVAGDANLASPWVAMQSIRSCRGQGTFQ